MAVWTAYVLLLGAVLLVIPNVLLSIFQIEETDEVWIRIIGLLLIGYGAYYWTAVQAEFIAMRLAKLAGINVAPVKMVKAVRWIHMKAALLSLLSKPVLVPPVFPCLPRR